MHVLRFSFPDWFLLANRIKPDRMSAERGLSKKLLGQLFPSWRRNQAQRDLTHPQQLNKTGHDHAQIHWWRVIMHISWQTFTCVLYLIPINIYIIITVSCFNLKMCLMSCPTGRAVPNSWTACRSDRHIYQHEPGRLRWGQTHRGPRWVRKAAEWKVTFNTATTWPDFSSSNQRGTSCYGNYSIDQIYRGFVEVLLKIPASCKSSVGRGSSTNAVTVKGRHKWERNHNSCWNGTASAHLAPTSGILSILLHVSGRIVLFSVYTGH